MSTETDSLSADVVIVGAGPTGLLLAGDLAAAGVRAVVVERAERAVATPKANGVVGRAAVELRRRGLLRGTGLRVVRPPRFPFGPLNLRLGLLRSPLHVLPIPQRRLEELLERRTLRLGGTVHRGWEVTGFEQDGLGVTVRVATPASQVELRAGYLVGCDGAHSMVRKQLGIGFPGVTSTQISRLARVTIPADRVRIVGNELDVTGVGRLAAFRSNRTDRGSVTLAPAKVLDNTAPDDLYIVSTQEPRRDAEPTDDLSEQELRASLRRVLGVDLPFCTVLAARSIVANSRQAERYRRGRVLLAGDAAHVFSAGGSALNVGLLDAVVLGTSLTAVLRGGDESLLDAYESQRRLAGQRAMAHTHVQVALDAPDQIGQALREALAIPLEHGAAARRLARLIEGRADLAR